MKKTVYFLAISFVFLSVVCLSGCGPGNGTWANTVGGVSSFWIGSLAYDSARNVLYAGTNWHEVWSR